MNSDNVIENEYEYSYKCEKCGKECYYGVGQLQKIVGRKILLVCEECYNE